VKFLAASVLLSVGCLHIAWAQVEEKVKWYLQSAQAPLDPFHQFLGATEPVGDLASVARWAGWDDAENLVCESSSEQLRAVALRQGRTWTLALWNRSPQKLSVAIEGELPAGVYTIERLTLNGGGKIVAVERRNGLRQHASDRKVQRTEWLQADTGLVLRFAERSQQMDKTLVGLRRSIWQSKAPAGVLSRLASLMREVDNHWRQSMARLRAGNVRMTARGLHRMLFLVSGIRAVASQYAALKDVTDEADAAIDALSELSSALLNVVVGVSWDDKAVKVTVINAGSELWKALRFALEGTAEGDTVVLANVRPLERAEASFQPPDGQTMPVVVVSVLFNNGYSRLKVTCSGVGSGEKEEVEP